MKRGFEETFIDDKQGNIKRAKFEPFVGPSALPKDVWGLILKHLHIYDVIFARATSTWLYKWCKEYNSFPRFFVLDQYKCMKYLVENGYISLLDYVKNTLRFEWTENLTLLAARSGQLDTLMYQFRNGGCTINTNSILLECARGSCDLATIQFLRRFRVSWDQRDPNPFFPGLPQQQPICTKQPKVTYQTVMENMAYHGHLECMRYAMENGCTQRTIHYTPSIECLDFAIQHGFDWKGQQQSVGPVYPGAAVTRPRDKTICEEAARLGNLTILKYAHQHGAPLNDSIKLAANEGHLDCLIYAAENTTQEVDFAIETKSVACLEYFIQRFQLSDRIKQLLLLNQVNVGNIEILRLMLKKGFTFEQQYQPSIFVVATKSFELFKFMIDKMDLKFLFDQRHFDAYHILTHQGNLEGLKLAFERNFPPVEDLARSLICAAVQSQNIDVLKFVWEKYSNKENFKIEDCLDLAAARSTPEIIDFLTQHGAQWTSKHLKLASQNLSLPNMAYLNRIGCPWSQVPYENATLVKYAREHGYPEGLVAAKNPHIYRQ